MACSRRRQLLADYLERVQALAVEMELLLRADDKPGCEGKDSLFRVEHSSQEVRIVLARDEEGEAAWLRIEESRIQADIARLALQTHMASHHC